MDMHWVVFFIVQLIYIIPIIAAIALSIAGLALRKSKPKLSKILLIIGGLCFCVFCLILSTSIFGAIFSGTLNMNSR